MKSEKRLIDANKLIDSLKEWLSASNVIGDWDVYHTIEDCICEVNAQPTIDAVEVVRCRDCKHFTEGMAVGMCKRIPDKPIIPMPYNAFCAFGERKEKDA